MWHGGTRVKLKSATIHNFRSIDSEGIKIDFGRFTTLVGANDSGKTATLLAILSALWAITESDYVYRNINYEDVYARANSHEEELSTILPPEVQLIFSIEHDEAVRILGKGLSRFPGCPLPIAFRVEHKALWATPGEGKNPNTDKFPLGRWFDYVATETEL